MSRWVLLIHELPDNSWHYDWLIQPPGCMPDTPLISFRLAARPDDPAVTVFPAERVGDHRPLYLSFEGPVSGGRGSVRRVAEGHADVLRDDGVFVVMLDHARTWIGRRRMFESPEYDFHLSNGPWIGHTGECPGV